MGVMNTLKGNYIGKVGQTVGAKWKGAVLKVWGSPNYFKFTSEFKSAKI